MDKYIINIGEAQLKSIMPIDHNIFRILHFEKLTDGTYLLSYQASREMVIVKRTELEVILEETKEI